MTIFKDRDEFSTLVQANQHNRHAAIMKAASELFIHNGVPSRDDLLHFEELCLRLLPKLDLQTKAEISERLSTSPHLPKAVALSLAREDISVAAPILHNYFDFNDEDLLITLANGNEVHALAISSRQDLSDKVIVALSKYKLPDFEPSSEDEIIDVSHPKVEVSEIKTPDITAVEETDESTTVHLEDTSSEKAAAISYGLAAFLELEHAHTLTLMDTIEEKVRGKNTDPASLLKAAYERASRAIDFVKLARKHKADAFGNLLAIQCEITPSQARRVIGDPKGFALAICLKALSLPQETAHEAFILLNPDCGQDKEQIFLLSWFYKQISPEGARHLLSHWQKESSEQLVEEKVHQPYQVGKSLSEARPQREHQQTDDEKVASVLNRALR